MDRIGLICRYIKEVSSQHTEGSGAENGVFRRHGEHLN